MALTSNQLALTKLYLAAFNRAPEISGLNYWNEHLTSGKTFDEVVSTVFSLDIVKDIYPDALSTTEFLARIYSNIFGKTANADELKYWSSQMIPGQDRSMMVLTIINAGLGTPDGTPGKAFIVNRYQSAQYAVQQQMDSGSEIGVDKLKTIMAGVNADTATMTTASSIIDASVSKPHISVASSITEHGINASQAAAGVEVSVDLHNTGAAAGYKLDLLINGAPFAAPVSHIVTAGEVAANKAVITIAPASGWGADGTKALTAQLTGLNGVSKVSDKLDLKLDMTAPTLPSSATLSYRWYYDAASSYSLSNAFHEFQFKIAAGQATGGKATLQIGPLVVATDSVILAGDSTVDFSLDAATGKLAYDALLPGNLKVTMYDEAGNASTGAVVYIPLGTWVHMAPLAPTGLTLIPVGGNVVANSLNASNTNLKAQATIVAGPATAGKAVLKIGDKVIATDELISPADTTVTFDVGSISSSVLQSFIASGGTASVTLYDSEGRSATSTNNPTLTVNYSGAGTGTTAQTLTAPTSIKLTPVGGTVQANTLNATNTDLTAQATIVAGEAAGGSAVLKLNGATIATDYFISASDTTVTFDVGTYTSAGLQSAIASGGTVSVTLLNASGQSVTSSAGNPFLTTNYTQTTQPSTTPSQLVPTQATYVKIFDSMDKTHISELHLKIAPASASGGSATLWVDGIPVASDNSISAGDTSIDFSLAAIMSGLGGSDRLIGNIAFGGTIKAEITDAARNTSTFDLKALPLPTQYVISGPTAPTNLVVTPVGGTVVTDALNATNSMFTAQASITPGQVTGGRAELRLNGKTIASDLSISASDSIVTFDVTSKPAFGGPLMVWVTDSTGMTTATSAQKTLTVDYTPPAAPKAITINPADANGTDKIAYLTITAGQAVGGNAKLLVNGQTIATDSSILASDPYVDFKLSASAASALPGSIAAGTATVEIMDAAGNVTAKNLMNLPLTVGTSPLTGDHAAPYGTGASQIGWGYNMGDTTILKFSEATDKTANLSNISLSTQFNLNPTFGMGASAVWNSAGDQMTITAGTGASAFYFDLSVTVSGVKDLAGNAADVVFKFS